MSKELQALEDIILYLNANEPKGLYCKNIEIIKAALKEHEVMEVMKQTKIVVSDPKVSDEDFEKLKNQGILTNLQGEIKPLFDEETQKNLKALEIIKKKKVDVGYLFEMIDLFGKEALTQYNLSCYGIKKKLTQKEFDLLKEVLK